MARLKLTSADVVAEASSGRQPLPAGAVVTDEPAPEMAPGVTVPDSLQPERQLTMTAPQQTPAEYAGQSLEAFGQGAASTALMGYDDELVGLMAPGDYTSGRDAYRGRREQRAADSPDAFQIGGYAGIAATLAIPASSAVRGAQAAKIAIQGGLTGLGHSKADLTKGEWGDAAVDTGMGLATGYVAWKTVQGIGGLASSYAGSRAPATVTATGSRSPATVTPIASKQPASVAGPEIIGEQGLNIVGTRVPKQDLDTVHALLNVVSSSSRAGKTPGLKNYPVDPPTAFKKYLADIKPGTGASEVMRKDALQSLERGYQTGEGNLGELIHHARKMGVDDDAITRAVGVAPGGGSGAAQVVKMPRSPGYRPDSSLPQGNVKIIPDGDGPPTELAELLQRSLRAPKASPVAVPAAAPSPAAPIPLPTRIGGPVPPTTNTVDITGRMLPPGYRPEMPSIGKALRGGGTMVGGTAGGMALHAAGLGIPTAIGGGALMAGMKGMGAVGQVAMSKILQAAGEGKVTGPMVQQALESGVPERLIRGIIAYYSHEAGQ